MATLIQIRRDSQANWVLNDPVLASGEIAFSSDQDKLKIGDGTSLWSALTYINALPSEITAEINAAISNVVGGAPELLDTLNELAAAINDDASFNTTINSAISSAIDAIDTDAIEEGSTNLYFTDARAQSAVASDISSAIDAVDTDDIEEGSSNLYFTNQRALDATSAAYDAAGAAATAESNANSYTDGRETAITTAYQTYADIAEADAISTAAADATSKANTAESNASTFTTDAINALDTDDLEEGSSNLYFTEGRAQDATPGRVTASITVPSAPASGDGWLDLDDGSLYIYVNDGDTLQWVQA